MGLHDCDTKCYIYNYTQLVGNQLMDQFDGDSGIEQKTTLKLVNVKSHLQLDMMPCPKEIKGMAKEFVYDASVIYDTLLNRSNILVYCINGRSCSPSIVEVFFIIFRGLSHRDFIDWDGGDAGGGGGSLCIGQWKWSKQDWNRRSP